MCPEMWACLYIRNKKTTRVEFCVRAGGGEKNRAKKINLFFGVNRARVVYQNLSGWAMLLNV